MAAYGSRAVKPRRRAVKPRGRRTNAELAALDDAIIEAVEQDAPVTLRGVFYRCFSMGAIPKTKPAYRTVGRRLLALRRKGRVGYADITDGTRWVITPRTFDSVEDVLQETARTYRRALWSTSEYNLQLFIEKDAISGVIFPVTDRWDVALGVLRGYVSESFAYSVAESLDPNKTNVLAELGDHDWHGLDIWRDFSAKVESFADCEVRFERLAVTPAQLDELHLPTWPASSKDIAKGWRGGICQVDAVPAPVLRAIVDDWIVQHVDEHELAVLRAAERSEREVLGRIARAHGGVR